MNTYERLLAEVHKRNIVIDENSKLLIDSEEGYYAETTQGKIILLSENLKTVAERKCILAEELGHYYTTHGNITDQSKTYNQRQELKSRRWSVQKLLKVEDLIEAFDAGVRNKHELAEHLEVTEEFLDMAVEHFGKIYGYSHSIGKHIIIFNPLCVFKNIE